MCKIIIYSIKLRIAIDSEKTVACWSGKVTYSQGFNIEKQNILSNKDTIIYTEINDFWLQMKRKS